MKVRIKVRPSGLLNGREWPEAGGVIDLPDAVAKGMIESGDAKALTKAEAEEKADESPKVETRPANTDDAETRKDAPVKRGPGRPRKQQG
jgi:hypothetical protein